LEQRQSAGGRCLAMQAFAYGSSYLLSLRQHSSMFKMTRS
jgi:hypothetical protein